MCGLGVEENDNEIRVGAGETRASYISDSCFDAIPSYLVVLWLLVG